MRETVVIPDAEGERESMLDKCSSFFVIAMDSRPLAAQASGMTGIRSNKKTPAVRPGQSFKPQETSNEAWNSITVTDRLPAL